MSDLVRQIAIANLAASVAIVLVLLLRQPVRKLLGAQLGYTLWLLPPLIAAAACLPPRSINQSLAVPALPIESPLVPPTHDLANELSTPSLPSATAVSINPVWLVFAAWLAGALAMLAWMVVLQLRFRGDAATGIAGPAVMGVLRPRIVVPADFETRFDASERAVILDHEAAHIRRGDTLANALASLLQCLCWFNPLIHVAVNRMRVDQELACDADVVARHADARRTYADALVKTHIQSRALPLGCYWPAQGEHPLLERIAMLKTPSPGKLTRLSGAALIGMLASGGSLAAWASRPPVVKTVEQQAPVAPQTQDQPVPDVALLPRDIRDQADAGLPVTIKGVVTRVEWINPATRIHVRETTGAKTWIIETADPGTMLASGGDKAVVQLDRVIAATAFSSRDGSCTPACTAFAAPQWMSFDGVTLDPADERRRMQLWPNPD